MVSTRTKLIGTATTSTIIALLTWIFVSTAFDVEIDLNDKVCAGTFEEPCEASFNITANTFTYYLYNKGGVDLNFIPNVKDSYICKKDGRYRSLKRLDRETYPCGVGYREFDFKSPLTSRYKYVEKFVKGKKHEYKLVVFKNNPTDEIKWGGKITGEEIDPTFLPVKPTDITENRFISPGVFEVSKCDLEYREELKYQEYISIENFTSIIINNFTGINTTIITFHRNETKSFVIGKTTKSNKINCRVTGLITPFLKVACQKRFRCNVEKNKWCYVNLDDGDKNLNYSQADGRGWDGDCISISDLKDENLKVSFFREIYTPVEKR